MRERVGFRLRKIVLLIFAIVVAFFLERIFLSPSFVASYLAFSTDNLLAGRVWTVVTALFVHASLYPHLFWNMVFLFIFGWALEGEVGGAKTVGLFFLGGGLTFLIGIPFYAPATLLVGASAAIFTLSAAIMLVHPTKITIVILPVGLVAALFFLENVYAVAAELEGQLLGNIAYYSHVIGFLLGIPFGWVWSRSPVRNLGITGLMLLVFLAAVFLVTRFLIHLS